MPSSSALWSSGAEGLDQLMGACSGSLLLINAAISCSPAVSALVTALALITIGESEEAVSIRARSCSIFRISNSAGRLIVAEVLSVITSGRYR